MPTIVPHLWYDKEAVSAVTTYVSLFDHARIINRTTIHDTPSGDAEMVDFELAGVQFSAINAGPYFTFNPSVSLMVSCATKEEVDRLYATLSEGGTDLIPLGEYPFSAWYVWVQDRFGLSWQLMLVDGMDERRRIRSSLLFADEVCGQAEEALDYYASVFKGAEKGFVNYYQAGEAVDARARINYAELNIGDTQLIMMDHGLGGDFTFNEAYSFIVLCDNQEEIDYYWERLSHVPEAEQCGWLKDRFGLSWQIVPRQMNDLLTNGTEEEVRRVTKAFLQMKKFDIAALERARLG